SVTYQTNLYSLYIIFYFTVTALAGFYTLSLHDALPISGVSAVDRCALSYSLLLELTSVEYHHWHDWFIAHPQAWAIPFATARMAMIGGVVHHIFGVELRYTQRLREETVSDWEDLRETTIEDVFALG